MEKKEGKQQDQWKRKKGSSKINGKERREGPSDACMFNREQNEITYLHPILLIT